MSLGKLLFLLSLSLLKFSFYSCLVFKLLFQDVIVLVHQTIFVIHYVVSSSIDPRHLFVFRLPFHHLHLHTFVYCRASNLRLIVFKCQRVQTFHLLHRSQLMFVAVSDVRGRRPLCHFFSFPHQVFSMLLLIHL